jgi:TRAP-type transport system periplasmic protein
LSTAMRRTLGLFAGFDKIRKTSFILSSLFAKGKIGPLEFTMFRRALILLLIGICLGLMSARAEEQGAPAIELRLGHNAAFGAVLDLTAAEFARRVNAQLRGRVTIKVHGNSTLGSDVDMFKQAERGDLDFALPSNYLSTVNPIFSVFDMPFLILSRAHIRNIRATLLDEHLRPAIAARGMLILGMWENGFRHMTNNVRPIHTPEDLKGLKMRVPQGSRMRQAFEYFGALPAEYSFGPPLVAAIKEGKFDGQENPFTQINSAKIDTVQKYLSLTYHNYTPVYLVMRADKFAALPPEAQAVIKKTAEDMQDWAMSANEQLEKTLKEKLSQTMQVNEADLFAFLMASFNFYRDFARDVPGGKPLIKLLYDPASLTEATGRPLN